MKRQLSPHQIDQIVAGSTLEWKLTDPNAFGLTTASPLQRGICRVADGEPIGDLAADKTVLAALGDVHGLPHERPREVTILSGIRTAKSLMAACAAFHMAVTCDVSMLRAGEIPRVSVVSLKKDLADVIMSHLVGSIEAKPLLKRFMVGDPTGDGIVVRHPSGALVEIEVVAGSRAGSSLVARWSAGCVFDEFPRMVGAEEGVVNWDHERQAVLLRLLKGCQLWHIGSPWAPYGPAFEMVTKHHKKPSVQRVVAWAPAPAMNPVWWTPERVAEARAQDEDAAKTDVDAKFKTPDEALFASESIDKCLRSAPLIIAREEGCQYFAAMDPATRGNGWTLAVATRRAGKICIVYAKEWIGSRDEPLDPGEVLKEAAAIVVPYGVTTIHSDQVMGDALVKLARQAGISLAQWTYGSVDRAKKYIAIRTNLDRANISLPDVPHLRTDLLHIRKRVTPEGIRVVLPMTTDGRHCDWGPTLMLCLSKLLPEQQASDEGPPRRGEDPETKATREAILARIRGKTEW